MYNATRAKVSFIFLFINIFQKKITAFDHMTKAAAQAGGFGFQHFWALPKPLLGRHQRPGLARPKQARLGLAHGFGPGQANH